MKKLSEWYREEGIGHDWLKPVQRGCFSWRCAVISCPMIISSIRLGDVQSVKSHDGLCTMLAVQTNEAGKWHRQQANTQRISCSKREDTQVMWFNHCYVLVGSLHSSITTGFDFTAKNPKSKQSMRRQENIAFSFKVLNWFETHTYTQRHIFRST